MISCCNIKYDSHRHNPFVFYTLTFQLLVMSICIMFRIMQKVLSLCLNCSSMTSCWIWNNVHIYMYNCEDPCEHDREQLRLKECCEDTIIIPRYSLYHTQLRMYDSTCSVQVLIYCLCRCCILIFWLTLRELMQSTRT